MRHRVSDRQAGFTLVEVLIVMAIFVVILLGMLQMFDVNQITFATGEGKVDVQQNARLAMDTLTRDLRMAGYLPELYDIDPALPTPPTAPSMASPVGVALATGNGIVVYGDLNAACVDPSLGSCGNSSALFLYCLNNGTILRRRHTDLGAVASYTCGGGDALAQNITSLTFAYYNSAGTLLAPPLDAAVFGAVPDLAFGGTAVRRTVRTVTITLTATESTPAAGKQAQSFTLTQSVRLRNLSD